MASSSCIPYLRKELGEMLPWIDERKFSRKKYMKLEFSVYALKIEGAWCCYGQIHSDECADKGLVGEGTNSKIYRLKNLSGGPELVRAVARSSIPFKEIKLGHHMVKGCSRGMYQYYPHYQQLNKELHHPRLCFTRAFAYGRVGESWKGVIFSPRMEIDMYQFLLSERGRASSDALILSIFLQVAEGLKALHALERVHRDLSLPNILLSFTNEGGPKVMICDFAGSKNVCEKIEQRIQGTVDTLDPLIYGDEPLDLKRCDVYSLVAALWQAWHGRHIKEMEADEYALLAKIDNPFKRKTIEMQGRNRNPELQMHHWGWSQEQRNEPVNLYVLEHTKRFAEEKLMNAAEIPQVFVEEAAAGLDRLLSQMNVQ